MTRSAYSAGIMEIPAQERRGGDAHVAAMTPRACRALTLIVSGWSGLAAADRCDDLAGRLVSVEGDVSVAERPARMDEEICSGETIEVGARGRAAVRLADTQTVVRIDQNSTFVIRPSDAERSWLELLRGVIYLFSRQPESLRVDTPYVNAAIDGTEFVIEASDEGGEVTVIEGSVLAGNLLGEVRLLAGETASAGAGRSPQRRVVVDPLDAVQWALHYPRIGASEDTSEAVRAAAERLARGDVERAEALLSDAPEDAASLALRAMIAVTRNRPLDAMRLAERAVNADAGSSLAYTALSYAQQARFEIEQALTSANVAVRNDPENADALARQAELELGVDDAAAALASASRASRVAPDNSRARTVLGFVRLVRLEVDEAEAAFAEAVVRDPGDPLPRLGLGLATIRDGRLAEGREHIEVAAALDPNDALVRSYLGKAYVEERESADAATQFALAQQLDPQDPTPWLYDALLDQALNRPVSAYRKINRARALNDNRLIYQSRLLVDKSAAAGSLSLARTYVDLGFKQPATNESTRSIAVDPTNFSAYRVLADSYADRERHESARQNVLFQAAMLQPMTVDPVQPYAQESDLLILPGTDPVHPSINEYSPLFDREGLRLNGSLLGGNHETLGDNLVLSALHDRFVYSLGQMHYETDGFRRNADIEHDVYHGFVQARVRPNLFVQAELRERRTDRGDLALNFDPDDFDPSLRVRTEVSSPRMGIRAEPDPAVTLLLSARSLSRLEGSSRTSEAGTRVDEQKIDGYEASARFLLRSDRVVHAAGIDAYSLDLDSRAALSPCDGVPCAAVSGEFGTTSISYHYYLDARAGPRWQWTAGLSHVTHEDERLASGERAVSPKLGIRWRPADSHELRLAVSQGMKRHRLAEHALEPSVLAGFNQLYDDLVGTGYTNAGIAYDWSANVQTLFGVEALHRELEVPIIVTPSGDDFGSQASTSFEEMQNETTVRGYWSRILNPYLAVGLGVLYERFHADGERARLGSLPIPERVETLSLPLSARFFHPSGFFAHGELGLVHQSIELDDLFDGEGERVDGGAERLANLDVSVGVKLPARRATFRIDVSNLFDESFLFQDHNIQTRRASSPRYAPGRSIVGRVSFSFR